MGFGIRLLVEGEAACFTRPEMKGERVSYDVITPSAARGVLEAIYWHPGLTWVIDSVTVLNEIKFGAIRRNELSSKIPFGTVKQAMKNPAKELRQIITEDRQQRATLFLRDVSYVIGAHFLVNLEKASPMDSPAKHYNMFLRRAREGQNYAAPYLGCREFAAKTRLLEEGEAIPRGFYADVDEKDLGWMLWDIEFGDKEATPKFFRALMRNGAIQVSGEVTL